MIQRTPDQVRRVPVTGHERYHARKYRHRLRKAALFAVRDGIFETVWKIRSKLVERRVEAAQKIMVCAWDQDGARRIAITRDLGGTPRFHPELVFTAPDRMAADDVSLPDQAIALLEAYLPVPECPLAGPVAHAVAATNPGLRQDQRPVAEDAGVTTVTTVTIARPTTTASADRQVFFIGYGGYVREQVRPAFVGRRGATVAGAVDHKAELLRNEHRGDFPLYRDRAELLPAIAAADRPLVIIASYHSDHVPSALAVLDANPDARVFIEKPAAVTVEEAEALAARRAAGAWIDIGFNRRYARMTAELARAAERLPRPLVFSALVKELKLPPSHWYHWPNQGTRVTGNLCHWIDLARYFIGEECTTVHALAGGGGEPDGSGETVSVILGFADRSIATLVATDAGDDLGGVGEYLELRAGETTLVVDDYHRLVRLEEGNRRVRRSRREKGHGRMYHELRTRWLAGAEPVYPAEDIVAVARITARIVEAAAGTAAAAAAPTAAR